VNLPPPEPGGRPFLFWEEVSADVVLGPSSLFFFDPKRRLVLGFTVSSDLK